MIKISAALRFNKFCLKTKKFGAEAASVRDQIEISRAELFMLGYSQKN
jgi:hypothetical protein